MSSGSETELAGARTGSGRTTVLRQTAQNTIVWINGRANPTPTDGAKAAQRGRTSTNNKKKTCWNRRPNGFGENNLLLPMVPARGLCGVGLKCVYITQRLTAGIPDCLSHVRPRAATNTGTACDRSGIWG